MASAVTELETGLNAMLNLKPPGVSGSQIKNITALCVDNVQSESVLIQKIYTHFKKTPGTHKLGVLYVVDSVTRRWIDHAKQQGQTINSSAPDGTFAAGVHRVTELLPVLMNDIIQSAPGEQKEKIKKLVDIWEKGQTFPQSMIESFKEKLNAPAKHESTTPIGSPPPGPGLPGLGVPAPEIKPQANEAPNDIMAALANIARQNTAVASSTNGNSNGLRLGLGMSAPSNSYSAPSVPPPQPQVPVTQSQPAYPPFSAAAPPINAPFAYPPQMPVPGQRPALPVNTSSLPNNGFPGANPMPPPPTGMDPATLQQVQLIKLLVDQGISPDKIPAVLASMTNLSAPVPPPAIPQAQGQNPYSGGAWGQGGSNSRPEESRDRNDFHPGSRSPNRYGNRSRSRSPPRHWDSPRPRNDRGFGNYGHDSPGRGRPDDNDRRRGQDYRQRSPPGRRGRSPNMDRVNPAQKWVDYDSTLPNAHIKVLSRTLFVGGVTCSEAELRDIFGRYGQVQTCIVNKDKRHAFVKMVSRRDAVAAKDGMENGQYRTRWGVGFGPRDCSDYQSGVSVIPISKLTDADRKWMLTAEYGGSGGRPIETGMVVEEPDIEIGAGVSSKAISRRMQTDRGGKHGPKSSRGGGDDDGNLTRWRRNKDNRQDDRWDDRGQGNNSQQPATPEFPYGIQTGPNGMPLFPPGFSFPPPHQ